MQARITVCSAMVLSTLASAAHAQTCVFSTRTFNASAGATNSTANALARIGNDAAIQLNSSARAYRWTGASPAAVSLLQPSTPIGPNWFIGTVNGKFFFTAGTRLYQSDLDGTNPTSLTALGIGGNFVSVAPSESFRVVPLGAGVLFAGATAGVGTELAYADGTLDGTRIVADINAGSASSGPFLLIPFRSGAFFFATTAAFGTEPCFSDGTAAGTVMLADLAPGALSSNTVNTGGTSSSTIDIAVAFQNQVYFLATPTGTSRDNRLYRTDGTPAGTVQVDLGGIQPMGYLAPTSAGLFFLGSSAATGTELYATDGSAAGTRLVRDLNPGAAGTSVDFIRPAGGRVFFAARVGTGPRGLFTSDGTAAGTVQLPSVLGTGAPAAIRFGPVVRGKFIFAEIQSPNSRIGITDGTPAGTCAAPGNFTTFFGYADGRGVGLFNAATNSRVFLIGGDTAFGNEPRVVDLCPADFDNSGGPPAPGDIYAFVQAFFVNDLSADFNGNGQVSVQDVFSFVAAYFAGCP